jgi:hypothetical protein
MNIFDWKIKINFMNKKKIEISTKEKHEINLNVLKKIDVDIEGIEETFGHTVLYIFNVEKKEWERGNAQVFI